MALTVRDLHIHYSTLRGEARACDGVGFSIRDGEILGVAGESGCGKSTLCNALVLLKAPMRYAGGSVELDGERLPLEDYEAMRGFRASRVAIVPQYAMDALNPTRKLGGLIRDLLSGRGLDPAGYAEKVRSRLDFLDLPESVLGMYPFELSGGMRQRATMVVSTLLDPSLLLCDEITSALDVTSQRSVVEMSARFVEQGITKSMIFVTHDLSVLYQIAHGIMIMYAGKVVERGPAEDLLRDPIHPYSRMLIDSLPELGARDKGKRLRGIPGRPPALIDPPTGCRFRERCPLAGTDCLKEPALEEVSPGRLAACWRNGGRR